MVLASQDPTVQALPWLIPPLLQQKVTGSFLCPQFPIPKQMQIKNGRGCVFQWSQRSPTSARAWSQVSDFKLSKLSPHLENGGS